MFDKMPRMPRYANRQVIFNLLYRNQSDKHSLKILRMTKPIFKKLYPATSRERGRERKGSENGNKFTSKGD